MLWLPFFLRPQPAVEPDPGHNPEFRMFLFPLDLAGEPASQAREPFAFPRTIHALNSNFRAGRYSAVS
jgi:hypothetical protein